MSKTPSQNKTISHAVTYGAQRIGLTAQTVSVEIDISRGIHSFTIIGLPDKAVNEAQGRMSAAIKHTGFRSPRQYNQKITVSLAPGELKKTGALFDVPIALAYLLVNKEIQFIPNGKLFIGELSLDGSIQRAQGILPLLQHAKISGMKEVYLPKANTEEASLIDGITMFGVASLRELIDHLSGKKVLQPILPIKSVGDAVNLPPLSFAQVRGQESVKRALTIATAGGHNVALYGPPGTGKTLLAKSVISMLPPLSREECVEVTSLHSIVGTDIDTPIWNPPFRSPHHSSSYVSVVGGGVPLRPGEISLAHRGVLFLDEFPEFDRRVIESLREPLEEKSLTITRSSGVATFPASCMLIIAFNPCPCGNAGTDKVCSCTPSMITSYRRKLVGPIIDRIDIWIAVEASTFEELEQKTTKDDINKIIELREQIHKARKRQSERFEKIPILLNSEMVVEQLESFITLSDSVMKILRDAATKLQLSPRGYHRVLKCAQTIADFEGSQEITEEYILEAIGYRHLNIE